MGRLHQLRVFLLLLMVLVFAEASLIGAGSAIRVCKQKATQKSIIHGVESINQASNEIMKRLSEKSHEFSDNQYSSLASILENEGDGALTEAELDNFFRAGYANSFMSYLGDNSSDICLILNSYIRESGLMDVSIVDDNKSRLEIIRDEKGKVYGLKLLNISIRYDSPLSDDRIDTLSYDIAFPSVDFFDGNEDLFGYCMAAEKGIYISGATSSVIGDIYAGNHGADAVRDAEIAYGETGHFGGLNFLTTQVGIEADRIVTGGDININGSFVIFTSPDVLTCYGHRINKIEGYREEAVYSMDGIFYSLDKIDEKALDEYLEYERNMRQATSRLEMISDYYDSKNDESYDGRYRKIISDSDVIIDEDITGIVITPFNVIMEKDVNFEGLVLCGDRIYLAGNNNVVSNKTILRSIISDEVDNTYNAEVKDYIGGIRSPGITWPEHLVVPYR